MTDVALTDRPQAVRNRCVNKVFGGVCMLSRCFLDFVVGVGFCHRPVSDLFSLVFTNNKHTCLSIGYVTKLLHLTHDPCSQLQLYINCINIFFSAPTPYAISVVCEDTFGNCAGYTSSVCTKYRDWSIQNCAKFCQFCHGMYMIQIKLHQFVTPLGLNGNTRRGGRSSYGEFKFLFVTY